MAIYGIGSGRVWLLGVLTVIVLSFVLYVAGLSEWVAPGTVTIRYWIESVIQLAALFGSTVFYYIHRYKKLSKSFSKLHIWLFYISLLLYPAISWILFYILARIVPLATYTSLRIHFVWVNDILYYGMFAVALFFWWRNWKIATKKNVSEEEEGLFEAFIQNDY